MSNYSTTPLGKANWNTQSARHLLNRAGFGGTTAQIEALRAMGLDGAVDYLLNSGTTQNDAISTSEFDSTIRKPLTVEERSMVQQARQSNSETVREQFQKLKNQQDGLDRAQMQEIQKWWLRRLIQTGRPLEEKLTLFWHGHFATGYRTIEDSYHMFQQNQLFRAYATGNFADLVLRILRNPAMLKYLDNDESRRGRPNENLARELMELFVLGEGHGYTENDIKEGARALTGFTFEDDTFRFAANNHDGESKTILGQTGNWDGDDFARIILSRRETSEFLCGKLYRFFVNDGPGMPDAKCNAYSNALAAELRKQQYELKPVLRMLFCSQHFYDTANRGATIKSPTQLIVQTIRELGTPPRELSSLNAAGDLMGQSLFMPPNVKGWDGGQSWINTSTYFVRQNLAVYLITGLRPDAFDWDADLAKWDTTALEAAILSATGGDSSKEADALLDLVLAVSATEARRNQFRAYVSGLTGSLTGPRLVAALCLVTAMPEFQLC
ncbi:MAG: DUF1800 domain-containing protein [Phycisphaerales bacterium]|nr:DUF1800 domain-containing protein [Phycisphaerales bacterium]